MNIQYQLKGHEYLGYFKQKGEIHCHTDGWLNEKWVSDHIIKVDFDSDEYIMKDIPKEFQATLSYMAYEQGHSSGEDEVRNYLRGYVSDLEKPIKAFEKRIRDEYSD